MIEIKAPSRLTLSQYNSPNKIFLGGSIEMGSAEKWQDKIVKSFKDHDIVFLNPRRDDWDSSWIQDPTPGTKFHEQVSWERNMQLSSDFIVYHFDPKTKSPITMFELGEFGTGINKNIYVSCNEDFWRYGNVKMFCDYHIIPVYNQLDDLIIKLKKVLTKYKS